MPHQVRHCLIRTCQIMSNRARPSLPSKRAAEEPEGSSAAVCNFHPSLSNKAIPQHTQPQHTQPRSTQPRLPSIESSREGLRPPCCRLQLLPDRIWPHHTTANLAMPQHAELGLTLKDAQHDHATSASMRFRASVTGTTSASNLPCFGRQSPRPTSLPASLAISSTSRKFRTSGSY